MGGRPILIYMGLRDWRGRVALSSKCGSGVPQL